LIKGHPGRHGGAVEGCDPHVERASVGLACKLWSYADDAQVLGPAEHTIRFAFDGTDYEIDLNAKNAAAFGKQLAPYLVPARRAGRAPSRQPGRTAVNRQCSGDIRAWAKEQGLAVSERGRIPATVVEQYHAAGGR
jgi:hypothetical protein